MRRNALKWDSVKQKNRRHTCRRFVNNQIKVGYEK